MAWWGWILVIIGVIILGYIKLPIFKRMKESKASKTKFIDED
jgi:hypothetical protein